MIKKQVSFFFIFILLLYCGCKESFSPILKVDLNSGWKFKEKGTNSYLEAQVPGSVQLNLLNAGIIKDPFYRSNEDSIQWIAEKDWEYLNEFSLSNQFLLNHQIELTFEGLDTYAEVFLNDSLILTTDNMFRKWVLDVTKLLEIENKLQIHFYSTLKKNDEAAKEQDFALPEKRAFTRKAPYQFGWDWGPRIITSGIWKPVYLTAKKENKIESVYFSTDSVVGSTAFISAEIKMITDSETEANLSISNNGQKLYTEVFTTQEKTTSKKINFEIPDAKLWWTNGLGDPHLYKLKTDLEMNHQIIDSKTNRIGVRTIQLVEEKDEFGKTFFFKLNGTPVFMKGANYIPQDNLLSRLDSARYKSLIESTRLANMNMLRVWGGGIYEQDLFYDLCDQNGILVWQDFMFAGSMYPGDDLFIKNCKAEISDQIIRLRNHPSIALWCGNNEVDEAWHNWGWQKQFKYSEKQQKYLWDSYESLFHQDIPELINDLDPNRAYWPSSPKIGWGHAESLTKGDSHYWGVWWGKKPFPAYKDKVGRFMSEYGFQSFPATSTLDSVLLPEDKYLYSDALKVHEKHSQGFEIIQEYLKREFKIPKSFEDYAYVSQLLQAKGLGMALEAHRRAKPYCMGSLYWQLNDCWPVISWSSLDYYGNWKALHYEAQKDFQDLMISIDQKNDSLKVYIVSDQLTETHSELKLQLHNFDGNILWKKSENINIQPNSCHIYYSCPTSEIVGNTDLKHIVFSASIMDQNNELIDRLYYFKPIKELELDNPELSFECSKNPNGYTIHLNTKKLAKNIFLEFEGIKGRFTNNYFDLMANKSCTLNFVTDEIIPNPNQYLKIKTLKDCY